MTRVLTVANTEAIEAVEALETKFPELTQSLENAKALFKGFDALMTSEFAKIEGTPVPEPQIRLEEGESEELEMGFITEDDRGAFLDHIDCIYDDLESFHRDPSDLLNQEQFRVHYRALTAAIEQAGKSFILDRDERLHLDGIVLNAAKMEEDMLNAPTPTPATSTVEFVSYDASEWCLCHGELKVRINGELVTFSGKYFLEEIPEERKYTSFWKSGGSRNYSTEEDPVPPGEEVITAPWILMEDQLPEKYKELGQTLIDIFNENVEWGCCGGCI